MKNIIDILNSKMPTYLSKTTKEYKAIFGKENFISIDPITQSSDYNCGAIANELEYVRAYIDYIVNSNDIATLETYFLDLIVKFFLNIKRISDESDDSLRNRFKAYLQRNGNKRWSTKWSFRDVFSYFFDIANVYVLENYIADASNKLLNSNLENITGNDFDNWTKYESGSSTLDVNTSDPFSESICAKYTVDASNSAAGFYQAVTLDAGDYKVSLFAKADAVLTTGLYIRLKRSSDSYYYNFDTNTWQSGNAYKLFDLNTSYKYLSAYFSTPSSDTITLYVERYIANSHVFYVDRIRIGERKTYPTVKVLIVTQGDLGEYTYLDKGTIDQFIDRGDCESTTPPAFTPETTNTLSNATFAQDSAQHHTDSNSYKFTKTVASGTAGYVSLQDNENSTDMHGLTAGKTYTFFAWIYIPSGEIQGSEIRLSILDYDSGWEESNQYAQSIYDNWQLIRLVRTLRNNSTGVVIRIRADSNADNNEYFYVDDIRVAEGDVYALEDAAFLDNDYMSGAGGAFTSSLYDDMLQRMKEAGSYAKMELVARLPV